MKTKFVIESDSEAFRRYVWKPSSWRRNDERECRLQFLNSSGLLRIEKGSLRSPGKMLRYILWQMESAQWVRCDVLCDADVLFHVQRIERFEGPRSNPVISPVWPAEPIQEHGESGTRGELREPQTSESWKASYDFLLQKIERLEKLIKEK